MYLDSRLIDSVNKFTINNIPAEFGFTGGTVEVQSRRYPGNPCQCSITVLPVQAGINNFHRSQIKI